jgi:uncharacterized protein
VMAHDSSDTNPLTAHGGLSDLEIPAVEPRKSADFYEQVLGWRIDRRGNEDFRFSDQSGLLIGRWVKGWSAPHEPGFLPFIYVDNVEAALGRAAANAREIVKPPYAEGDLRVARIRDPAGNVLGLWQFAAP